jgi:hypothetical protein
LYGIWKRNNKELRPTQQQIETLLTRNFALHDDGTGVLDLDQDDFLLLVLWITQILPVAAGNTSHWGPERYLYMTVQQGHFPGAGNERKLYVPPSTEAIAAWIIENNLLAWIAQWMAKEEHGDYPVMRRAKDAYGNVVTMDESCVSSKLWSSCPFCRFYCPFLTLTLPRLS